MRRQYLDYCQMHALLRSEHGLLTSWSATAGRDRRRPSRYVRSAGGSNRRTAIQFGCGRNLRGRGRRALACSNANRQQSAVSRRRDGRAQQGRRRAIRLWSRTAKSTPTEGMPLRQGLYELLSGLVEIEYRSGAVLVVRAPATFDLVDQACVRLEDGQLAAHVPKAAIGFRIESPGATVIDLGTDFAVQAVKEKESEVHVFHGEVLVDLHGETRPVSRPAASRHRAKRRESTISPACRPASISTSSSFCAACARTTTPMPRPSWRMNPAVYYRMEPTGDGTRLIDASASGADATIHFGRATSPVWTSGRVGAALSLGGPAQQTYAAASEYPQAEGDAMTVVAWVYARSRPRWASIAKNWAGGNDDHGQFHFGLYEDGGELEAHIVDRQRKRRLSFATNFRCRSTPGTTSPSSPMARVATLSQRSRSRLQTLSRAPSRPKNQGPRDRHETESRRRRTGRARFQHVGRPPRRTGDLQPRPDGRTGGRALSVAKFDRLRSSREPQRRQRNNKPRQKRWQNQGLSSAKQNRLADRGAGTTPVFRGQSRKALPRDSAYRCCFIRWAAFVARAKA